jgi:hypothetical protein
MKGTHIPRTWLHSHIVHESANHLDVVTRNDHLLCCIRGALREGQTDSHIRSPQEELWSIALSEGSVSSSFILGQNLNDWMSKCTEWRMEAWTNVDLSLELFVGLDGAGSSHYHSSADLVTLDTTDESTHVVASLTAVQFLVEHLCKKLSVCRARM